MAYPDKLRKVSVIKYSMLAILSVFFVETFLGLVVGSLAIISDGFHALFDFTTMLILFIYARISSKPPDEDHMYGHEKFEYLGGMIGGIMLIILAAAIALEATQRLISGESYLRADLGPAGYAALAYTFFIDLFRIFISRLRAGTPVIKAAFYHAFSDLCSTLIALLGFWLSLHGVTYGDSLASLTLSTMLAFISARFVWSNIMELSDIAPRKAVTEIKEQMEAYGRLLTYENLRVRRVGNKFFIRANLKFPDYVGLEEAHNIATEIERKILGALGEADISFHLEPNRTRGLPTKEFIRRIASGVEGVLDAHDVEITHHNGRTYVSLHILVEPKKPLSEAHKVAEMVERAVHASMGDVEQVFVHIEPSNIELNKGSMISDQKIDEIVQSIIKECGDDIKVKRIVTYPTKWKRQVNIECIISGDVSVEEAYKIALKIENMIKERIPDVAVTVHMEPGEGLGYSASRNIS